MTVSTVLFTDVVGSTEQLVRAHDSGWDAVLEAHRAAVRQTLIQHREGKIGTAGDGFLAIFALPSEALQCDQEITADATTQGLQVRAGVHTGEVITGPSDVVGVAYTRISSGSCPRAARRREHESAKVRLGDVLVCPIISPVWSVVFPNVGALVTDTGGVLSHPAIIAREYRVPAVVATGNATELLRDGHIVTVDGQPGTVEIEE